MLKPLHVAAILLACATGSPALARSPSAKGEIRAIPLHVDIAPATPRTVTLTDRIAPDTRLFDGAKRGLGFTARTYRMDDGSSSLRKGLVGSWSITRGMNAGIGLFSVTHENQKEPEFRRNWTAKNVYPRSRKVAAVGLSVGF